MAVNWGSLIFGGVNSSDYGIYLSGEGVYNAPERAVEVVDVPGRNGSVIIDQGHWNNIEVVYRAGVFGADQEGFAEKLSAFRNAILSQKGYQRLEDTYHPEEFRMGAYVSGLEVSPASYNRHGEFELIFNCKPQRWLVDGELLVPVNTLDVLQNPTEYDSSPLLQIDGYGSVQFNGYDIGIIPEYIGNVTLVSAVSTGDDYSHTMWAKKFELDSNAYNPGDVISVGSHTAKLRYRMPVGSVINIPAFNSVTITQTGSVTGTARYDNNSIFMESGILDGTLIFPATTFIAGTPGTKTCYATFRATGNYTFTIEIMIDLWYQIEDGVHSISRIMTSGYSSAAGATFILINNSAGAITVNSTKLNFSGTTYLDCDLGEAYTVIGDTYVDRNQYLDMFSDLPTLSPGSNQVVFDNTITDLKIAPRWWKL